MVAVNNVWIRQLNKMTFIKQLDFGLVISKEEIR